MHNHDEILNGRHIELAKLAAALEQKTTEIGDQYRWRALLRLGKDIDGLELCAIIEPRSHTDQLPRFVAFGSTARAALAKLKNEINAASRSTPSPSRQKTSADRLKRLAAGLADEQVSI